MGGEFPARDPYFAEDPDADHHRCAFSGAAGQSRRRQRCVRMRVIVGSPGFWDLTGTCRRQAARLPAAWWLPPADSFFGNRELGGIREGHEAGVPDRPIVDLPDSHPLFHTVYDLDAHHVPNWNALQGGVPARTNQRRFRAHWRAILPHGRVMVAIAFNNDLATQPAGRYRDYPPRRCVWVAHGREFRGVRARPRAVAPAALATPAARQVPRARAGNRRMPDQGAILLFDQESQEGLRTCQTPWPVGPRRCGWLPRDGGCPQLAGPVRLRRTTAGPLGGDPALVGAAGGATIRRWRAPRALPSNRWSALVSDLEAAPATWSGRTEDARATRVRLTERGRLRPGLARVCRQVESEGPNRLAPRA